MPPHINPPVPSHWDRYQTPDDFPPTQLWLESPLGKEGAAPKSANNEDVGHSADNPVQNDKRSQPLPVRGQSAQPKNGKKQELRFFNVSDPKELKDRSQLRLNRRHVMHTFLDKERQKPSGQRDARVDGAGAAIKRKRSRIQVPTPFAAAQKQNGSSGQRHLPTPDVSDREAERRASTSTQESTELKRPRQMVYPLGQRGNEQLVKGLNGSWDNSRYIRAVLEDIPFHSTSSPFKHPETGVGANLNPFDTWPAFSDENIDVNQLKYSCSRRFGSEGISRYWVPELLRARHAFLSTICISSAHDDIMSRAQRSIPAKDFPSTREGIQRLRVRSEVISMVNQSLEDPELRTADATIISVLHLLNSEIMGCNDLIMKTHQDGLHRMVRQRGGLEGLGVHGQLARILTITMYMISALRESPPHADFVAYASRHTAPIPTDTVALPESPIYCRASGYQTITPENCHSPEIWGLLNTLRDVTRHFLLLKRSNSPADSSESSARSSIVELRDRIFELPPAHSSDLSFPDLNTRYIYETLRLAALLYVHALYARTPFSIASIRLTSGAATSATGAWPAGLSATQALHLQIRNALLRTDCTSCWGPLAGVLFWVALVSGAGANPGPLSQEDREGEEEDARKFLAAIAVRCSIVLSFEHGEAVLEGLRRLVGIEGVLNASKAGRGGDQTAGQERVGPNGDGSGERAAQSWMQGLWTSEPGTGTWIGWRETAGPEVPRFSAWNEPGWAQMGDFARDFEGLS